MPQLFDVCNSIHVGHEGKREKKSLEGAVAGVIDTRCGIPPHDLDKVFERFYRSESGSPDGPRWGLGLPIARSLVNLHGSQIWVESTPGQGSRFYFTVPIKPPPAKPT